MQIYLVGGAVRDELLELPVTDNDYVVVGASPEKLLALGYKQVGQDFPVFLHPKTREEYALARTEQKKGHGYKGFSCSFGAEITLEEDLLRRDLTINAMAKSMQGDLYDPYCGSADLKAKILRHVSPSFSDDPLRVLRVARFAARFHCLGFSIAPETLKLMSELANSGELAHLTPERVWNETVKALGTDDPQIYFSVLRECDALKVLFPEIDALFGVPAPKKWHPEVDTGIHTLMVLKQSALLSKDIDFRFASLTHDLGKALTPKSNWPSHHGHGQLGIALIKNLVSRLKIPNDCLDLAVMVSEHHTLIHNGHELKPATLVALMTKTDAWRKPERFHKMLRCGIADARGRLGFEHVDYPMAEYVWGAFLVAQKVDVQEVIKLGAQGAEIKRKLHDARVIKVKAYCNAVANDKLQVK